MSDNAASGSQGASTPAADAGSPGLLGTSTAAPATTSSAPTGDTNGQSAWYNSFAQGLDEPVAKQWGSVASRYQTPQDFAKAHIEMRNTAVFLPKEPKPEDTARIYERLGWPKEPTAYQFADPSDIPLNDGEKAFRESFRQVAHRAQLTQAQVKALEEWNLTERKTVYDAEATAPRQHYERAVQNLKKEWGMDFERNLNTANAGIKQYGRGDWDSIRDLKLADGSIVGDRPEFARIWARIGSDLSEDDRRPPMSATEVQVIDDQIQALQQKAKAEGKMPWQEPYHSQIENLMRKKPGMSRKRAGGAFGAQ